MAKNMRYFGTLRENIQYGRYGDTSNRRAGKYVMGDMRVFQTMKKTII
jgi:hypothetical protein